MTKDDFERMKARVSRIIRDAFDPDKQEEWRRQNPELDEMLKGDAAPERLEELRRRHPKFAEMQRQFRLGLEQGKQPQLSAGDPRPTPPVDLFAPWREGIIPPTITMTLGKRNAGKSALNYMLLEAFRYQLSPFLVGAPAKAEKLLPNWMGIVPSIEDLPPYSIALIDEAYLPYHSRSSSAAASKDMSQILNLSRQKELTLLFVTQEARQLDKNIASAASVYLIKDLGMLQLEFERPELKKVLAEAQNSLDLLSGDKRPYTYVYSPDANFKGLLKSVLPSFWKPSFSRLFAAEGVSGARRAAAKLTPQERAELARELYALGYSYSQIANQLGVSKGTVSNYLRDYPYVPR